MERKVKLDHAGSCGPLTALSHSKSGVQEVGVGCGEQIACTLQRDHPGCKVENGLKSIQSE